jgi:hypothetical protein
MDQPNLFNALFKLMIRENHSPKENFLSECFAHMLRTVNGLGQSWVSKICKSEMRLKEHKVSTRNSEIDPLEKGVIFPDLRIDAVTKEDDAIVIFAEHKWNSPCNIGQLKSYRRIAENSGRNASLCFVGARRDQVTEASKHVDIALYWEEVYEFLQNFGNQSDLLKEFLIFMKSHGLSPVAAVTPEKLKAFVESNDLLVQLSAFCRKLADDYKWEIIPARYHGNLPLPVEDRWGRVGIEFAGANWAPAITLGFLYSGANHRVPLTDPNHSIDLSLRISADPKLNPNPESTLAALRQKVPILRQAPDQVLVKGDPTNENPHTLLIVQRSLAKDLSGIHDTHAQLDKIRQTLIGWLSALFQDGTLETELLKLKSQL